MSAYAMGEILYCLGYNASLVVFSILAIIFAKKRGISTTLLLIGACLQLYSFWGNIHADIMNNCFNIKDYARPLTCYVLLLITAIIWVICRKKSAKKQSDEEKHVEESDTSDS